MSTPVVWVLPPLHRCTWRQHPTNTPMPTTRRNKPQHNNPPQNERVLFHYNGHGVPRPTANGEIWVFNKNYTQYIPLSLYDLQSWVGTPAIYVFDCSAAGLIINSFKTFAAQRMQEVVRGVDDCLCAHCVLALCACTVAMCSQHTNRRVRFVGQRVLAPTCTACLPAAPWQTQSCWLPAQPMSCFLKTLNCLRMCLLHA